MNKPLSKIVLFYSVMLALAVLLIKWIEFQFIVVDYRIEVFSGAIALVFTALGIWLALASNKKVDDQLKATGHEVQLPDFAFSGNAGRLGLSKREVEVLELIAQGLSNQEIAAHLFVSLNTIKTHTSKLFEKMEVKRRTQAVDKAKRLGIIP